MNFRAIAVLALALSGHAVAASAQTAGAQKADPNESRMGAEMRLQRELLAEHCGSLKHVMSCAMSVVTGHPFHVSFGSIAPLNGFGGGPAIVTHFTPKNWRVTWSGDAVWAGGGAWRAGTYMKAFRTKIEPPQLAKPGEKPRPIRITEYPVYTAYAQTISLPSLAFYGIGADAAATARTTYGMTETIFGGSATIPFGKVIPALKLSVLLEANGRLFDIRNGELEGVPVIGDGFTETTAPGLDTQPNYLQFGEGVRLRPWLFNDRLQLGYTFLYQQFLSTAPMPAIFPPPPTYSFQRWTVDLNHVVPLYRTGGGPVLRDERNTPNECSVSQSVHDCASVTRDRWGSVNFRALISKSHVGDNAVVPFYLQRTLGGSDINSERALASYDDYRFRGPHVILFQGGIEHALWGPIGAQVQFEGGKVAAQQDALSFDGWRHSVGVGLTIRAGGFPVLNASWHTGGPEGHHFIATMDVALLGGGSRPSLR
jgi:hypothetical protein